jgi:hypothetical protein
LEAREVPTKETAKQVVLEENIKFSTFKRTLAVLRRDPTKNAAEITRVENEREESRKTKAKNQIVLQVYDIVD